MQGTKRLRWLAFMIGTSSLCGCARHYSGSDFKLAPRGRTFTANGEYLIGLNDKLAIRVVGSNDISGEFTVSQSGIISLPLIGAFNAAGVTERDLAKSLSEQYKTYLKNPVVSVGVTGYESYRVYITGEVRKP